MDKISKILILISGLVALGGWLARENLVENAAKSLNHAQGLINLTEAQLRERQPSQALAHLAQAVRLDPNNAAWRGMLLDRLIHSSWLLPEAEFTSDDPIRFARFLQGGQRLLTVTGEEMQIRDVPTGTLVGTTFNHPEGVLQVTESKDERWIASAGGDGIARLWDAETGQAVGESAPHSETIIGLAFSADSQQLFTWTKESIGTFNLAVMNSDKSFPASYRSRATAPCVCSFIGPYAVFGEGKKMGIWSLVSGKTLAPRFSCDYRLAAVDNGKQLMAMATNPPRLQLFTKNAQDLLQPQAIPKSLQKAITGAVRFLTSTDGHYLLTIRPTELQVWEVASGRSMGPAIPRDKDLITVWFDQGGKLILGESLEKTLRVWKVDNGKELTAELSGITSRPAASCPAHNRTLVMVGETFRLLDSARGEWVGTPIERSSEMRHAEFSADCRFVVAWGDDKVQVIDGLQGTPVGWSISYPGITAAFFSPDSHRLATVSPSAVQLWRMANPVAQLKPFTASSQPMEDEKKSPIQEVQFTESPQHLLITEQRPQPMRATYTFIWDILNQRSYSGPWSQTTQKPTGVKLNLSPDGHYLVVSQGGQVEIWPIGSANRVDALPHHHQAINHVAFNSQGGLLATASRDATARVWSLATGQAITPPLAHSWNVAKLFLSAKGRRLLTLAWNHAPELGKRGQLDQFRLWDLPEGRLLGSIFSPQEEVEAAAFSPDGTRVLVSTKTQLQMWDADKGIPLAVPLATPLDWEENVAGKLSFTADGRRALAWGGTTVLLMDSLTGEPVGPPLEQENLVTQATFDLEGQRLLTLAGSHAQLWDPERGTPLGAPFVREPSWSKGRFINQGQLLLSEMEESRSWFWDVPTATAAAGPLLADLAEILAGYRVTATGGFIPVENPSQKLAEFFVVWTEWLKKNPDFWPRQIIAPLEPVTREPQSSAHTTWVEIVK